MIKMTHFKHFLLAAFFVAALGLAFAPQEALAAKTYRVKIGCTVPTDHPIAHGLRHFAKEVERLSNGRMKCDIMDGGQLGTGRKLFESVQNNVIQICDNSIGPMAVFTDKLTPLSLPYLFPSREIAYEFADGPYMKNIVDGITKETGLKIVAWYENGIRQMTNARRPITSPDDMKGLKMRVMENPLFVNILASLGANPVPMAYAELYTAMQQKTVDGQENPLAIIVSSKYYEVQQYLSTTAHCFDYIIVVVNEEWYEDLPKDLKKAFDEAMLSSQAEQRRISIEREAKDLALLEGKMQITYLTPQQREVFRAKMQPVYNWFVKEYPKQKQNMENIMKEVEKLSKK
ncbi:TRAP transporter substrate-binding protein [Desulfovibrio sp. OttesenSCG-928-C14]|nr:TRAP transporter substrate-binding protein [Desulfovibrio sp. OttesenSCG-928-C14]